MCETLTMAWTSSSKVCSKVEDALFLWQHHRATCKPHHTPIRRMFILLFFRKQVVPFCVTAAQVVGGGRFICQNDGKLTNTEGCVS